MKLLRRPTHATVVAYLALFMAMSGTAVAATGGTAILGKWNSAGKATGFRNPNGPALKLSTPSGSAPMKVATTTKVANLNADRLDGVDATAFLRTSGKATDAERIDGVDSTALQRILKSSCAGPGIAGIAPDGTVSCVQTRIVTSAISNIGGSAICPFGWKVTGGGFELPFVADESKRDFVRSSRPTKGLGDEGWAVTLDPVAANGYQVNGPSTVYAICIGS